MRVETAVCSLCAFFMFFVQFLKLKALKDSILCGKSNILSLSGCVIRVLVGETDCTDHPDHDVGEASDPDGGGEEGDHEPSLPAPLATVGHGEEQK